MKVKQLKIVLKFSLCLLLTSLFTVSCYKDDDNSTTFIEEHTESLVKRITLEELRQKIEVNTTNYNKLEKLFDVNKDKEKANNIQSRTIQDDNPWLMTDEIAMIEKEGYATYTFRIGTQTETQEFYNLVATIDSQGHIISTRVLEYLPDESWLANNNQPFLGSIRLINTDIFSNQDILNSLNSQRFYTCVTSVDQVSTCNEAQLQGIPPNGHYDGHPDCGIGDSWEMVTVVQYGTCYEPDNTTGDSTPIDTSTTGNGGGGSGSSGSGSSTNTTNDCVPTIDNPCPNDSTNIMPPRDNEDEDETPCPGDPVPNPEIAPQTNSGINGGRYGYTRSGGNQFHGGLDLKSTYGDPIYAMYDGHASSVQKYFNGAGWIVYQTANVNGENITIQYFHLQEGNRLSGQIKAGDIIGYQGDSGNLAAAINQGLSVSHLHIKIKNSNGETLNPEDFLTTKFDDEGNVNNNCE